MSLVADTNAGEGSSQSGEFSYTKVQDVVTNRRVIADQGPGGGSVPQARPSRKTVGSNQNTCTSRKPLRVE